MTYEEWCNQRKKKSYGSYDAWSKAKNGTATTVKVEDDEDIAPVKNERTWFNTGAFDDVDSVGDILKTIGASATDVFENLGSGVLGIGEELLDWGASLGASMNRQNMMEAATSEMLANAITGKKTDNVFEKYQNLQNQVEKDTAELVAKDLYNEEQIAKKIISAPMKSIGVDAENDSIFGEKSDSLIQSGGKLLAQIGVSAIPGVGQAGGMALMGATAFGSEAESALNQGATFDEALLSSAIAAGAEMLTEKIGGISFGGKTLTDAAFDRMSSKMTTKLAKVLITSGKVGVDALAEGGEELLSGYMSAAGQKLTYMKDSEIEELFSDDDKLESFLGGVILGGAFTGGEALITGRNPVTGMTKSEQAVVEKVYQDSVEAQEKNGTKLTEREKSKLYNSIVEQMDKGGIDIDTIESTLGGDAYKAYNDTIKSEEALKKELAELSDIEAGRLTRNQQKRLEELEGMNLEDTTKRDNLRAKLDSTLAPMLKNSRLSESYNERARKGQAFEADLSKYEGKQRAAVERAIKSGVLNNTYRSHELVETLSKIEADKGIAFDYTNNAKLKESGFAIDGKQVNGFVKDGNVTLNVQSSKAWQSTVGHEVAHVLEGTESYSELQKALFEYAESKGELESRKAELTELYKGMNADIDAELTADLVGDYLFTDKDFIDRLTGNRTLFQKIYDEIKYLYKVATGKELTELEKVKREFDRAWKEQGQIAQDYENSDSEVKYSIREEAPPKKTQKVYKLMRLTEDGKLAPLFIDSTDKLDIGKWYNADSPNMDFLKEMPSGIFLVDAENGTYQSYDDYLKETGERRTKYPSKSAVAKATAEGKRWVYIEDTAKGQRRFGGETRKYWNLGINGSGTVSEFSMRPGWHAGSLPTMRQIGKGKNRDLRDDTFVWVEGEVPADIEYQTEANQNPDKDIPTHIPVDGYYLKATNADKVKSQADKVGWYVAGAFKPNRIISDSEARSVIDQWNAEHPDSIVEYDYDRESGMDFDADSMSLVPKSDAKYSVSKDSEGNDLSLAVQKRFANSKAVDENGNLKVLYHGTANGEFYTFDKSKGSVEGDFGSGFYFTDSESDVENNYEDGGADFENKVARRAEQIEQEEDIDYHEAEARAREELYVGGYKHTVYLNIENPAVVGETNLLDYESYASEYDPDDYESEEDYQYDVEQLISDDIDQILWDVNRNVDVYDTEGLAEVLWNAVNEGGIDIEQLKANVNNLYLEDSNGNFVGNEVTRQIIESLGYDGIIDNTVSTKFNMGLDEGTTHYIVFKPNQIKSVSNQNPTDNPDIRYSLSDGSAIVNSLTGKEISRQTYDTLERLERGEPLSLEELDSLPEVEEGKVKAKEYRDAFLKEHPEFKDVPPKDVGTYLIESEERKQLRNNILSERLQSGSFSHIDSEGKEVYNGRTEKGRRLDIVIGLPAAGKSSAIVNPLSQYYKSVVVDSDIVKGMLPEFNGGWGATLVHEESSKINMTMLAEEMVTGNNIVLPIVGAKVSSVEKYLNLAKERGYDVHLHLNELNSSKAMGRMLRRYFTTGRFIPPEVSWVYGDKPTEVYEELISRGVLNGYSHWNNDVARGQRPTLADVSGNLGLYAEYSSSWRAARRADVGRDVSGSSQGEYANFGNKMGEPQGFVGAVPTRGENAEGSFGLSRILRLNLSPASVSKQTKEALAQSGVVSLELVDSSADSNAFSIALSEARTSDKKNGWAVTPKTAEELVENNVRTIMTSDGKAGLGVAPDGDIEAVFKNQNGGKKGVLDTLIPAALEMGGNKLDCYGDGLVKLYARYGFVPVARLTFNPEYANEGWDESKGTPDIFFMVHNGDSADTVAANIGKYKKWTTEELNALPLFDKEAYDDAYSYRDSILNKDIAPTVSFSLSKNGQDVAPVGNYSTPLNELALEQDVAPVKEAAVENVPEVASPFAEDYPAVDGGVAPMTEEEANALQDAKVEAHSATTLEAIQTELANVKELRSDAFAKYEQKIAQKQAELNSKKNKDTKVAHNLRMQIERLKRLRDSTDADYSKRISNLETREKLVREGKPTTRQELHNNIVNDIKATFSSGGFDFDEVLENAKNLSTFSTVDNTPQRVMEKALGYKEGQVLADLTVNKVAQNESEGIKWLNSFTDRKNGLLAKISKQYGIKPGSKESAAAQMYAEGFYVNENNDIIAYGDAELAQDFPDANKQRNIKGLANDPRIRQIYDETLAAINESRTRNAYPEIQKLDNYFLHFRAMDDTFSKIGLPFNPNDIRAKDLPTDLNGVTADLKPGQPYFASAMHRRGKRTSFDLLGGLERYLTSAKNQIYHIDDIQTLRALRNYIADTYGQAHGLENIDMLSEEEAQERIEQVYGSHLSTFAKFLNEEANVLAGKTALIDRGLEGIIGRRGMTFFDTVNRQVGSNMVGFNISSSLTNFIPVAQTFAKTNKFDFLKAFTQTVSNKLGSIVGKGDSFAENSPVIIRRKGADRFYRTPFQKAGDAGYVLMSAVDDISTELIARTKYNELTRKGMSEQQAHFETDKWVSRLMGDRSLGQQPQMYNSKTLGILTKFQLEVRNQLDSQFYDTIQEAKVSAEDIENGLARNAKIAAKVTSTFLQLAVAQHLFGKAFESVAGYNPAFDIISTLATVFGFDDDEESEDTVLDNIEQGFFELMEDLPYTSTFTGGRIPLSSALPIAELIKGKDSYGNEKSRLETLGEVAPYYVLPGGYGQVKKTAQGLSMFSDEHPVSGSYTNSGNLRFPVEDNALNRLQAGVFGQYASENAREYFDNGYAPLKENQIQEYKDVDIPIKDYWEYRKGLAKQETLEDKFDYIAGLDLPVEKKNILINNVVDRKEKVDLENYDDFSSLEEFDFATNNPEKYSFAKSVGGYYAYKTYSDDLYGIKADKDENGKSINGSRKEKVLDYINNLDADYETKIILWKSEYPSDDTYNAEIIDYVNNREDLTYEERIAILTELGFRVSDGYIYAD